MFLSFLMNTLLASSTTNPHVTIMITEKDQKKIIAANSKWKTFWIITQINCMYALSQYCGSPERQVGKQQ